MISPYVRRMRLAAEVRKLRDERGLTHQRLAEMIGQSRAQISRLENGHVVDVNEVVMILDAMGVDGDRWTEIVTIARDAASKGWWDSNKAMGQRQALFADLEAGAATIREFQATFVPGLLQTPQFARARGEAERLTRDRGAAGDPAYAPDKAVEARASRQRMLRRPGGPTYEVILDEVAVRRLAAPPEVVKAQLYHVAAVVNGSPSIGLRVLPVDAVIEGYSVPRSAFSLYTYPDPGDPDVAVVDTATDDVVLMGDDEFKRYNDLYHRLRDAAWPVDDSIEYLVETAKSDGAIPEGRPEPPAG